MLATIGHRLLLSIPLLLVVTLLTFVLNSLSPSDLARTMLGADGTQEQYLELRQELGLDRPVERQGAIGKVGMGVKIAAPEAALEGEWSDIGHVTKSCAAYGRFFLRRKAACRVRPRGRAESGRTRWLAMIGWPA